MAFQHAVPQDSLGNDSFPTPLPIAGPTEAPSVISSQMTDLGSESGEGYQLDGTINLMRPGTAISGGTFSNDPNRPTSAMSSQPRSWTQSQTSRRDPSSPRQYRPWKFNGAFGGPGIAMSNTSRPQSQTSSLTSRTHVPSLASHAFFRPMSSQRLQAQRRGARVPVGGQSMASIDGSSDFGSTTNRNSIGSNATAQPDPDGPRSRDGLPQSRGTGATIHRGQHANNASIAGNATVQSISGSERPLNQVALGPAAMYPDVEKNQKHGNGRPSPVQRSPRSFRPSFLLPSRGPDPGRTDRFSRERLSSSNSSPRSMNAKMSRPPIRNPGFNYQYFSGNTTFCWGGRLQNTRDRPINIISGILIVLPSIIFFASS
ncbi:MAG: hypothetical protein Q9202_003048 [Teloschistes flavicans]